MSGPERPGDLVAEIVTCRRCPRLVAWREQVAIEKVARYRDDVYWGRPVPGFGDLRARILLLGLAEAGTDPVNHAKFGIKIAVAAAILLLAWPRRKEASIAGNTYHAIGLLALLNVAVAVFVK